jgi:hypothetical protein
MESVENECMSFLWLSEWMANIPLDSTDQLVFLMEKRCVFLYIRMEYLNKI